MLPPVSPAPCFSIGKPATRLHTLEDYIADGLMSEIQADALRAAVTQRDNILVAGGTSSGKTTLANALLAEMAPENAGADSRVILIEDTRELQCPLPDTVALRTRPPHVSMTELVRSTNHQDFGYRWVTRFIALDKTLATKALTSLKAERRQTCHEERPVGGLDI